jgi:hypothetical protein
LENILEEKLKTVNLIVKKIKSHKARFTK